MAIRDERPIVVLRELALELLAPSRRIRRKGVERVSDRRQIQSKVEPAAADETELRVELVQVPHDSRRHDAFEAVHLVIERANREPAAVEHEVLPHDAARVREPRWK